MKSGYWIKLHLSILDDPKLGVLDDRLFSLYIKLLLYAKQFEQNGQLPEIKGLSWRLRIDETILKGDLEKLAENELVQEIEPGIYLVTDFEESQAAIPVNERVRKYRERKEKGNETLQDCNENVTNKNNSSYSYSSSSSDSESDSSSESSSDSELFQALTRARIIGRKRDELARLPHMSVDYVESWDAQLKKEKGDQYNPGILIRILEENESVPKRKDSKRYDQGPFSEFINH